MDYIFLLLIGLLAGTVGSLVGLGGGIIVVPLLVGLGNLSFLHTVSPQMAVGTSMVTVLFTGLSSTLTYMKLKRVDYKSGLVLFIGSGPAGILGSYVNKFMNLQTFNLYFGSFMILVALLLIVRNRLKPLPLTGKGVWRRTFTDGERTMEYGFNPWLAILISVAVGFISGLFGIGGGSLLVPAMVLLFSFPPHVAVATSMFILFLSAIVSSGTHIALGNVNWLYAAALIPGAWFGGKLGAYINTRLSGQAVINALRITLILVGIRLIWSAV
ncbi:sulfite exporter TauE/SafE family protein [Ectobacillus ponti]|uniref:Probable membrane transporter protein n=1 Tax=Ectobacillus ponti TaxID=2961894 RepID=A0AA41X4C0_9BACI|nr:sulfite exporter TauE/SafE family protein [Ectobacillus ponti]MCP8968691.1 sulfite exporter TauE/SafE family protein [Ectobacillus ponti]